MKKESITVIVADDHPVVRQGLVSLIDREADLSVIGEAANGLEAVELYRALRPDIVLMDLRMPEMEGAAAVAEIRKDHPGARVIVLTTFDGDEDIFTALRAGAKGYLLKETPPEALTEAIRAVHRGLKRIAPEAAMKLALRATELDLTEREREVMQLLAQGLANQEIADSLSITEGTVKFHLNNIFAKLGVDDRTQAVVTALKRGLVRLGPL